jgi:D-alanyl-D-alanine dipeptidase
VSRNGIFDRWARLTALAAALWLGAGLSLAGAEPAFPAPFVALSDIDPTIRQDMRYAGRNNFIGRPLAGYDAPSCLVAEAAARALARAQAVLADRGLSLLVLDCYRPQQATDDIVRWAAEKPDARSWWHPAIRRGSLFDRGYIARRSGHSRGYSVDLTIVRTEAAPDLTPNETADCTQPPADGATALDFGTAFDCFDPSSATQSTAVSRAARANRDLLVSVMAKAGFRNYAQEWWHFSLVAMPANAAYHDFAIRDR